ncbi:AraC family transcriptional regulator [Chitinimonas sp. BJYL2]|uniref:AraC family transcriptional regulator n=1 Tax=Chitinimonas sp. BJYL2 TaxID=2976696 RepID=UPI0022B339A1|nr:AraC family transcriptional regulator [Chitinimonas sp. BJYL2]
MTLPSSALSRMPPTTSAAYVLTLLDVAERQGAARQAMLKASGIADAELVDPLARIELTALVRLFEAAAEQTGNARIGLDFGLAVRPSSYSGLGYVAMTCATLRDAIALIPRFGRLVFDTDATCSELVETPGRAMLVERVLNQAHPSCIGLSEAVLAGWVSFGRWLTGRDEAPLEIHIREAAPADTAAYQQLFRCPVRFGMSDNALVFPPSFLDLPVRDADPLLHRAMLQAAEAQLDRAFAGLSLKHRVRLLLDELLPLGEARLEQVTARLGMSERTLQRRLAEEGCSFTGLLDGLRRELAQRYLQEPTLGLADVAQRLGFAEQSSFSHAFRDWQGCSPLEYRQALRQAN